MSVYRAIILTSMLDVQNIEAHQAAAVKNPMTLRTARMITTAARPLAPTRQPGQQNLNQHWPSPKIHGSVFGQPTAAGSQQRFFNNLVPVTVPVECQVIPSKTPTPNPIQNQAQTQGQKFLPLRSQPGPAYPGPPRTNQSHQPTKLPPNRVRRVLQDTRATNPGNTVTKSEDKPVFSTSKSNPDNFKSNGTVTSGNTSTPIGGRRRFITDTDHTKTPIRTLTAMGNVGRGAGDISGSVKCSTGPTIQNQVRHMGGSLSSDTTTASQGSTGSLGSIPTDTSETSRESYAALYARIVAVSEETKEDLQEQMIEKLQKQVKDISSKYTDAKRKIFSTFHGAYSNATQPLQSNEKILQLNNLLNKVIKESDNIEAKLRKLKDDTNSVLLSTDTKPTLDKDEFIKVLETHLPIIAAIETSITDIIKYADLVSSKENKNPDKASTPESDNSSTASGDEIDCRSVSTIGCLDCDEPKDVREDTSYPQELDNKNLIQTTHYPRELPFDDELIKPNSELKAPIISNLLRPAGVTTNYQIGSTTNISPTQPTYPAMPMASVTTQDVNLSEIKDAASTKRGHINDKMSREEEWDRELHELCGKLDKPRLQHLKPIILSTHIKLDGIGNDKISHEKERSRKILSQEEMDKGKAVIGSSLLRIDRLLDSIEQN